MDTGAWEMPALLTCPTFAMPRISLCEAGLLLGATTPLAWFAHASNHLDVDRERLEAMFSAAFRRGPSSRDLAAIDTAAAHWRRGDKALANLRLVFADLPRLHEPEDTLRLKAAELLFDAGLRADDLAKLFEADPPDDDFEKYDENQPRVPAGSGKESGRWTSLWSRFSAWLDEEVPEYDTDTGDQVGTRSRARAILTNPLMVGLAGTAALFGGEVLLPTGAAIVGTAPEAAAVATEASATVAPVLQEAEVLSPFAQRYLSMSGGRLGSTATRRQLYEIAEQHAATKEYTTLQGDGRGPEEFLRDPLTGRGTYVDFTAKSANGGTVRIQTVDTLADGITPTARELAAARQIQRLRPDDKLILVPKR